MFTARSLSMVGLLSLALFGKLANGQTPSARPGIGAIPYSGGTTFRVWAPNARRVSVVGDFNAWDGRKHIMRPLGQSGVWATFVPQGGLNGAGTGSVSFPASMKIANAGLVSSALSTVTSLLGLSVRAAGGLTATQPGIADAYQAGLVGDDDQLRAVAGSELGHGPIDVGLGRQRADVQLGGHIVVGAALRGQRDHFPLLAGQATKPRGVDRMRLATASELVDDAGGDGRIERR